MECLPWHLHEGIFVLHSCRGGAFENSFNSDIIEQKICLANTICYKQKNRCLGQTIYANFAIDVMKIDNYSPDANLYSFVFEPETTAEEDAKRFRYRSDRYISSFYSNIPIDRVLWGYALLTGKTKMMKNKKIMKKLLKNLILFTKK